MIPQNLLCTDRFNTDLKHGEILAGPFSLPSLLPFFFFFLCSFFLSFRPLTLEAGTGKPQSHWLFRWLWTEDQVGPFSFVSFLGMEIVSVSVSSWPYFGLPLGFFLFAGLACRSNLSVYHLRMMTRRTMERSVAYQNTITGFFHGLKGISRPGGVLRWVARVIRINWMIMACVES